MRVYPIKEKIREVLEQEKKKVSWLLVTIDKSESWYTKLENIEALQISTVNQMSEALNFDLIVDYYKWKGQTLPTVAEPVASYAKPKNEISVTVTITGEEESLFENLGKTLKAVKKESERNGLKIG